MQLPPELIQRLVEMAEVGCTPLEIQHALSLPDLSPELRSLILQTRLKALNLLPRPSKSQIRHQRWLNRQFRPPSGCDPYR